MLFPISCYHGFTSMQSHGGSSFGIQSFSNILPSPEVIHSFVSPVLIWRVNTLTRDSRREALPTPSIGTNGKALYDEHKLSTIPLVQYLLLFRCEAPLRKYQLHFHSFFDWIKLIKLFFFFFCCKKTQKIPSWSECFLNYQFLFETLEFNFWIMFAYLAVLNIVWHVVAPLNGSPGMPGCCGAPVEYHSNSDRASPEEHICLDDILYATLKWGSEDPLTTVSTTYLWASCVAQNLSLDKIPIFSSTGIKPEP